MHQRLLVGDGAASLPRVALLGRLGHGAAALPRVALLARGNGATALPRVTLLGGRDGAASLPRVALLAGLAEGKFHGGEKHVDGCWAEKSVTWEEC